MTFHVGRISRFIESEAVGRIRLSHGQARRPLDEWMVKGQSLGFVRYSKIVIRLWLIESYHFHAIGCASSIYPANRGIA